MKVIPAIDLLDGQVVRLHKGSYDEVTVYNDDPLTQARIFKDAGFRHIHVVDLNGAREGTFKNLESVQSIVAHLDMSVQMGGGIRSFDDARHLIEKGVTKIVCSSMAVKSEDEWFKTLDQYGSHTILGMDLKEGQLAYSGWEETSEEPINAFLNRQLEHGLEEVLCTDISRDGTLEGVNHKLYQNLHQQFPQLNVIASGGVSGEADLKTLQENNVYGVVVGRAYYENKLSLDVMKEYHG